MELSYKNCNLCSHRCFIDRTAGELGFCGMSDSPQIARAALHMWEEPVISGERGSGTIFFSGCSLGCVFCQNNKISHGRVGKTVSLNRLSEIMTELQVAGAHNINFVTPTHYAPSVKEAVALAKNSGLDIPIVYNTSSYDTVETVKSLADTVDIYLADYKFYKKKTALYLSSAENYPEAAALAIAEMYKQKPSVVIENGIMKSGVIVRILLLPEHVAEAKLICKRIYDAYGDNIYISLMNQYTPMKDMKPPLDRRVTLSEYEELVSYAQRLGVKFAFTQERESAKESFIPDFDLTGVV